MPIGLSAAKAAYIQSLIDNMKAISVHPEGQALSSQQIQEFQARATADANTLEDWIKEMIIDYQTGLTAPNGPVSPAPGGIGLGLYQIK